MLSLETWQVGHRNRNLQQAFCYDGRCVALVEVRSTAQSATTRETMILTVELEICLVLSLRSPARPSAPVSPSFAQTCSGHSDGMVDSYGHLIL